MQYRRYVMNLKGHLLDVKVVNAGSDMNALTKAAEFALERDRAVEVWDKARGVGIVKRDGQPILEPFETKAH